MGALRLVSAWFGVINSDPKALLATFPLLLLLLTISSIFDKFCAIFLQSNALISWLLSPSTLSSRNRFVIDARTQSVRFPSRSLTATTLLRLILTEMSVHSDKCKHGHLKAISGKRKCVDRTPDRKSHRQHCRKNIDQVVNKRMTNQKNKVKTNSQSRKGEKQVA